MVPWMVRTENLTRLLLILSRVIGYRFDEWDEDAIGLGLKGTDAAEGLWYEYELCGRETIALRLALGSGDLLVVEASAPLSVEAALSPIIETSDREIVEQVYRAFAGAPRPEHPVDYRHCPECEEHDTLMRARRWDTLTHDDVRDTWSPVGFLTPEGFRYWMPAFIRLALERHGDSDGTQFVDRLLAYLSDRSRPRFQGFTPAETRAVLRFLQHVAWWRPDLIDDTRQFKQVARALGAGDER